MGKQPKSVHQLFKFAGKQPKYNNKEKKIIKSVLKNLKNETSPDGINDIISRIDETIKWDAINKPSSRVEKVLKKIRKKASNTLKKNIKGYEESRKKQQEFLKEANKILGSRLADTKDASKLFKRQQEEPIRKALEKLDELEPQSKLLDRAENLRIQKQFSNIFPGQGGGSGSAEGIANISRALLPLAGGSMIGGVPGAVVGTASTLSSSPRMLKNIIRRSPASISALGKFLASSNISTPIQRNQDGSLTQERLNKLRGERN